LYTLITYSLVAVEIGRGLEALKIFRALDSMSAMCVLVDQKLAALGMISLANRFDLVAELEAFVELVAVCGQFAKIANVLVVSTVWRTPDAGSDDIEGQVIILRLGGDAYGQNSSGEDGGKEHIGDIKDAKMVLKYYDADCFRGSAAGFKDVDDVVS
jgi:hypothetical protein